MPPLERKDLKQRAVLWPAGTINKFGSTTVGAPVEIECRWIWTNTSMTDGSGNSVAINAQVVVDQSIDLNSRMWLADNDDPRDAVEQWYGVGSAGDNSYVMQVSVIDWGTDLKNRFERNELGLTFYRDDPGLAG